VRSIWSEATSFKWPDLTVSNPGGCSVQNFSALIQQVDDRLSTGSASRRIVTFDVSNALRYYGLS
jgi:hypothetical protein